MINWWCIAKKYILVNTVIVFEVTGLIGGKNSKGKKRTSGSPLGPSKCGLHFPCTKRIQSFLRDKHLFCSCHPRAWESRPPWHMLVRPTSCKCMAAGFEMKRQGIKPTTSPSYVYRSHLVSKDRCHSWQLWCFCASAEAHSKTPTWFSAFPQPRGRRLSWSCGPDNLSEHTFCPAVRFDARSHLQCTDAGIEPTTSPSEVHRSHIQSKNRCNRMLIWSF